MLFDKQMDGAVGRLLALQKLAMQLGRLFLHFLQSIQAFARFRNACWTADVSTDGAREAGAGCGRGWEPFIVGEELPFGEGRFSTGRVGRQPSDGRPTRLRLAKSAPQIGVNSVGLPSAGGRGGAPASQAFTSTP